MSDEMPLPKISFLVIDYSAGGGVEKVTAELISRFRAEGWEVDSLISIYGEDAEPLVDYPENLRISVLSPKNKRDISRKLSDYFDENPVEALIFQGDNMGISLQVLHAAKSCGVAAFPQFHGSPYAYFRKYIGGEAIRQKPSLFFKKIAETAVYPLRKWRMKAFLDAAPFGVFPVSEGSSAEFRMLFGDDVRVKTIYNPLTYSTLKECIKKGKTVTFIARLETKHKNAMLVLQAWEKVFREFPEWKLRILGDGSLRAEMEAFTKSRQMQNVYFEGYVKNVLPALENSRIALLTSDCEGFPTAVVEAMAQANAVVSTRSDGGIVDLVIHGKTGLLSPKNNAQALADNLAKLMRDPGLAEAMGKNALDHVSKLYSTDVVTQWRSVIAARESR